MSSSRPTAGSEHCVGLTERCNAMRAGGPRRLGESKERWMASGAGVLLRRLLVFGAVVGALSACAAAPPASTGAPAPPPQAPPAPGPSAARPAPAQPPRPAPPAPVEPLPESFESDSFVVVLAKGGDTAAGLAQRFLGDPAKAWMIEDYNGTAAFTPGREVVIPKRP